MVRARNTVRSLDVHLMLPEDLMARVYAHLHDPDKGRMPQGAQARFFEQAARELLQRMEKEAA